MNAAQHVWFAKQGDAMSLPSARTSVWPNVPASKEFPKRAISPSRDPIIIFVANIDHYPNRAGIEWFLRFCWDAIRDSVPGARVRLVGRGNWASIRDQYHADRSIDFVGAVDDLSQYYFSARVAIAPVFIGAGSQIKVIESCAYGLPVVCSSMSASGFGELIREQIFEADTPERFACACKVLLTDYEEAEKRGAVLREIQLKYFSRSAAVSSLRGDISAICLGAGSSVNP
jgi:hypothetical protein